MGTIAILDVSDVAQPAIGQTIYVAQSDHVEPGLMHDACFAGDTLVAFESSQAVFLKL